MRQNVPSQVIGAQMVSATDGSAFTGSVTVYVTVDGGTQAVGTVGSGAATHEGQGFHTYAPSQAETNGSHVAFTFTGTGAVPATVQVYTDFPQTGDSFARIGATGSGLTTLATAAALATVDSNVDAILVDTGTTIPASLTTIDNEIAVIDSNVDAILVDTGTTIPATLDSMAGATFDTATDSLEALRNRGDAAWTTGGGGSNPTVLQNTTIATLATQTSFTLTAGSADNDAYNGAVIVFTDQSTSTQKSVGVITDYVGSTRTVTLLAAPAFTIATGDTVDVVAPQNAAYVAAALPEVSSDIAAAVWDEPTSGHTTAGTFGEQVSTDIDAILVDTGTTIPASLTTIDNEIATIDANVDAILVDTGTTLPATLATIDGVVDGIAVQTSRVDALIEDSTGDRFTSKALEQAPSGTGASAASIRAEIDANSTQLAAIRADTEDLQAQIGVDGAGLTAIGDTRLANLDATVSSRASAAALATVDNEIATLQTSVDAVPTNAELTTALDGTVTALATAALSGTEGVNEQVTVNLPGGGTVVRNVTRAARTNPITATVTP